MQEVNDCVLLVIIQSVCNQTNYSSQKAKGKGLICLECDYKLRRNQGMRLLKGSRCSSTDFSVFS